MHPELAQPLALQRERRQFPHFGGAAGVDVCVGTRLAIQKGTRVLILLWDSPMFGRVPDTRPNISESQSEISTLVPFCVEALCDSRRPVARKRLVDTHAEQPGAALHAN